MVISAVIYIMPHRQCSPALWMMVCFIQRTKSCPSRVGRFQHNGKKKKKKTRTKHQQNGVQMNQTLLSTVPGNWQTVGDSWSLGHARSWAEEHPCPGHRDVRNSWDQSPSIPRLECGGAGGRTPGTLCGASRTLSVVLTPRCHCTAPILTDQETQVSLN